MSTSYDPMDCTLLDSSVHGILQTRILEWVVILWRICDEDINIFINIWIVTEHQNNRESV